MRKKSTMTEEQLKESLFDSISCHTVEDPEDPKDPKDPKVSDSVLVFNKTCKKAGRGYDRIILLTNQVKEEEE